MPRTKKPSELTLHNLLSRLDHRAAVKLLGAKGEELLRRGGKWDVALSDVALQPGALVAYVGAAAVTVTQDPASRGQLRVRCGTCRSWGCTHAAATLSFVLEEKLALGLSAEAPDSVPLEHLTPDALIARELAERAERAREEKMTVQSADARRAWTDYRVTSHVSGKTYRVALRSTKRGESFCSCPDFRKNRLGTCKHVLRVLDHARRAFSPAALRRPYRRRHVSVSVRYGETADLVLHAPEDLPAAARRIVAPVEGRDANPADLLRRVGELERLGVEVTIYPDADDPIGRRLFERRIRALVAEVRRAPDRHPLRRELLRRELLPYQLDAVAFVAGAGRAILADDMGLGKTVQAIGAAELLAREAGIERVLVVCPASLKAQWHGEIARFSGRGCALVQGSAAERAAQYGSAFFTVCNYEQLLRDLDAAERVRWDLIVLDEAQRIKNWEAKTSRVIKALRSRFALALTGTPLENRLEELHSVVEFVDDQRLGATNTFLHRHRVVDGHRKVLGYKGLGALRARLAPVMLRRTRAQVLGQLPPRTTEIVRITPTAEQLDVHDGHLRVVAAIVRKHYLTEMDLLRLRKALAGCRMAADSTALVDRELPGFSSKLEVLDELAGRLGAEQERKVIVFSEWTRMLDLIEPLLRKRRLGFVRLDGAVPQKKRQALVHAFDRDPDCRFFLASNAGATGLNLQRADTVINVDLPWNPALLEQRIARAHRMGQTRPVHVFVLVTEGTLEEKMLATLSAKHDLALAALDPASEVDAVKLEGGMDALRRRLEVLLGAAPEAPPDESAKVRAATPDGDERDARVAKAASDMLRSAFALVAEMLPDAPESKEAREVLDLLRGSTVAAHGRDGDGRIRLALTLPAVGELAASDAEGVGQSASSRRIS